MIREILHRPRANRDLDDFYEYIGLTNPPKAERCRGDYTVLSQSHTSAKC
jgi:plasmid stabilization system protein ParE